MASRIRSGAVLMSAVLLGCGGPQPLAARGGQCFRAADCREGLVCIEFRCSNDLTDIGNSLDGPVAPAAPSDAAAEGGDAGPASVSDASVSDSAAGDGAAAGGAASGGGAGTSAGGAIGGGGSSAGNGGANGGTLGDSGTP